MLSMETVGGFSLLGYADEGAWGFTPSALPGISPSRGEIDPRQALAHLNA